MADALHILLDDRSLIQVGCHIMGRRTDQFHPAIMRLVIGTRALEAGQEAVMNVDAAAGQRRRETVRQDLHVARQHHQIGPAFVHQRQQPFFLRGLRFGRHGQVVKGNRAEVGVAERRQVVVGNDPRNLHVQLADPLPIEQVHKAVIEFRDQNQHTGAQVCRAQRQGHAIFGRQGIEPGPESRLIRPVGQREAGAKEEPVGIGIVELARFGDVATGSGDVPGDGGNDARPVGAGQDKDVAAAHGFLLSQSRMRTAAAARAARSRAASVLPARARATPMRRQGRVEGLPNRRTSTSPPATARASARPA